MMPTIRAEGAMVQWKKRSTTYPWQAVLLRTPNMRSGLTPFAAAFLLALTCLGGCYPLSMGIFTPIPIQPWVAERMEEKICIKNDYRTPILPPIPSGYRPLCEDPPDRAAILRAMPRVTRGVPYFYEEHRDDIEFTIEKLVDVIDPPRFYPLIGPAQLHHCHYKCTIYYDETIESSYPFPFRCKRRRVEVVYIDKDHLHLCGGSPETNQAFMQDMIAN